MSYTDSVASAVRPEVPINTKLKLNTPQKHFDSVILNISVKSFVSELQKCNLKSKIIKHINHKRNPPKGAKK